MRRWLPLVGVLVLGLVLGAGTPAWAHNQLVSSNPEDGATVEQGPDEIELTFLQSLDPDQAELSVTGPDGDSAVTGDPVFDGSTVTVPVGTGLAGDYELIFDVFSNDGHWVDGAVTFTVTEGDTPEPSPESAPEPTEPPASPDAATPAPAAQTGDDPGTGLAWWVWLLLALALAAGAAGAFWLARRGRAATAS